MTLYIVPTPIGNLGDITLRALEVLRSAEVVACEDTRRTLKLLNRYEIKKPLVSLHRHNERARSVELLARIENGESIALVSDAGTPGISDPGAFLIASALARGLTIEALPGANALLPALLLSGLDTSAFLFVGFVDGSIKEKGEKLSALVDVRATLVLYVAPHDLGKQLELVETHIGNRPAALARELTKIHEEVLRGTVSELRAQAADRDLRGEMVLVVAGREDPGDTSGNEADGWEELAKIMKREEISDRVIANVVVARYGIPRNRVKRFITHLEVETNER